MSRKIDIERWKTGKDDWSSWAESLLEKKKELEKKGEWRVDEKGQGTNKATEKWISEASVDFSGYKFNSQADFREFVFPCRADFSGAQFPRRADFSGATFCGSASFRDATFHSVARFNSAKFQRSAEFRRTTFSDNAWFRGLRFKKEAVFSEATFQRTANFGESRFCDSASFNWVHSTGSFSLTDVQFVEVPDFTQTSFRAPMRLDNLVVPRVWQFKPWGNNERAARYRALKKIAIESHDHFREMRFFADEVRERRGNDDPQWGANWWFGLAYELFSNFGQSIFRPVVALFASSVGFACLYGWQATGEYTSSCSWPNDTRFLPEFYLSFLNSLPVVGFARTDARELAEECLFGASGGATPAMDIVFIGQNILSAILIFLLLLAVRNHFRIK